MSVSAAASVSAARLRGDARTIALVGLAHGSSHFFHLMLAPLFPWLIRDFGLSYTQTGLLVSVFFAVSGVGQALSGFLVDRVGARPVLFTAFSCFVLAALAGAAAQGPAGLMAAAALAGLGNAPFHPVDFSILNQRVAPQRLGHAYSVHGISGNLGWAAAPLFLTTLTAASGSWRVALLGAALWAALVLAVLVLQRDALAHARPARVGPAGQVPGLALGAPPRASEPALAFLRLPAVWLCFSFFFFSTCALAAVQSFAAPALHALYGVAEERAALVVSGYMLAGAAGMVVGGFLVARVRRIEGVIATALLAAAALLMLVGQGLLPGGASLAIGLTALAGFGSGLAGPSRDMLIKQAAPPGATGRVYGTVYSGLDLGFAAAAPLFGALLDHHQPAWVFGGAALALVAGVVCAAWVGTGLPGRPRAALP